MIGIGNPAFRTSEKDDSAKFLAEYRTSRAYSERNCAKSSYFDVTKFRNA